MAAAKIAREKAQKRKNWFEKERGGNKSGPRTLGNENPGQERTIKERGTGQTVSSIQPGENPRRDTSGKKRKSPQCN